MYKYLIVGVALLIIGSAGYYFRSSGGSDLVTQAIAANDNEDGTSSSDVFSGPFVCEIGCSAPTYFLLHDDTTLEILTKDEAGERVGLATGSWGVGNGGAIVFLIDAVTTGTTSPSYSFVAKKASSYRITKFSAKIKNLGLENPSFKRIGENEY